MAAASPDARLLAKLKRLRSYKPGKYGKGLIQSENDPEAMLWRIRGGWNGAPHHREVGDVLQVKRPNVAFHIDKQRRFYFHSEDPGFVHPHNPAKLAAHVHRQYPALQWGKITAEEYERQHGMRDDGKTLAMAKRPLRDFERGAHLHVLDWAHDTARYRFMAAGAVQIKAAAKAIAKSTGDQPPQLPSLEAALCGELRKLYALGHATVRSELDHQQTGDALPVGLSAAPQPPNLRKAKTKKGRAKNCGTCKMFDASAGVCWGYGNYPVKPNEVCDSYSPDPKPKQLAIGDAARDPGSLRTRARLAAADVAHAIWQAIQRAKLLGITDAKRLRQLGRDAGQVALRQGASHHAGGAINGGRHAAALTNGNGAGKAQIVGARYTSVLDKNTCGPCAEADDGQLRALDDPALIRAPNPACLGGGRCRCIWVYQLSTETSSQPDVHPIAAVGVGGSLNLGVLIPGG